MPEKATIDVYSPAGASAIGPPPKRKRYAVRAGGVATVPVEIYKQWKARKSARPATEKDYVDAKKHLDGRKERRETVAKAAAAKAKKDLAGVKVVAAKQAKPPELTAEQLKDAEVATKAAGEREAATTKARKAYHQASIPAKKKEG